MARPPKENRSRQVRVYEPVGEWIEEICRAEGVDSADVTTPVLRAGLEKRYEKALVASAARIAAKLKELK